MKPRDPDKTSDPSRFAYNDANEIVVIKKGKPAPKKKKK